MTSTLPLGPTIGVEALLGLMVRYGATLVRMPDGLEVHLPAVVPAAVAHTLPAGDPVSKPDCPCGHSHAEHSDAGCLQGCPLDDCAAPGGQSAD